MTVFHIAKNTNYAVMSNHHLTSIFMQFISRSLVRSVKPLSEVSVILSWNFPLQIREIVLYY